MDKPNDSRYLEDWERLIIKMDRLTYSERMPSVRLRGVSARIRDKEIPSKVRKIRKLLGPEYKIVIEGDHISVEGDIQDHDLRKKIDRILAS